MRGLKCVLMMPGGVVEGVVVSSGGEAVRVVEVKL